MKKDRSRLGVAMALTALWIASVACSSELDREQAARDLAALVPDDAPLVVRLSSLVDLNQVCDDVADSIGGRRGAILDVLRYEEQIPGNRALIVRGLPIALVVMLPRARPPAPVVMVPTSDPQGFADSITLEGVAPVIHGQYVALPFAGGYEKPARPSTRWKALEEGLLAGWFDPPPWVESFGPFIEMFFTTMEAQMAQDFGEHEDWAMAEDFAEYYVDLLRSGLDSIDTVDFELRYESGWPKFVASAHVRSGSEFDGWGADVSSDWKALVPTLSPESAFSVIYGGWSDLVSQEFFEIWLSVWPEDARASWAAFWGKGGEADRVLGTSYAFEVGWERDEQLVTRVHVVPPSGPGFLDELRDVVPRIPLSDFDTTVDRPTRNEDADGVVDVYRVRVDPESVAEMSENPLVGGFLEAALDGEGAMSCAVTADGTTATITLPHRNRVVALPSGGPQASLGRIVEDFDDSNAVLLYGFDLGILCDHLPDLWDEAPPPGHSMGFGFGFGTDGRTWRVSVAFDLVGMMRAFQATQGR